MHLISVPLKRMFDYKKMKELEKMKEKEKKISFKIKSYQMPTIPEDLMLIESHSLR